MSKEKVKDESVGDLRSRSPEAVLDELRDAWLCCAKKVKVAIIANALLSAEQRGRERGIEEAAEQASWRAGRILNDGLPVSAVNELLDLAKRLRALAGNAALEETPGETELQAAGAASLDATEWLIWSFEHDAWWAPRERGYTKDVESAGRYSRARAEQIVRNANLGRTSRNEEMLPAPKAVPDASAAAALPEEK